MNGVGLDAGRYRYELFVELAAQEGYSLEQFLASAAGEKLAVLLTTNYLECEAQAGRREDFERYLSAVPDVPAPAWDRMS